MVHSYSTLILVYWCVRDGFSELWLIPILVVNAVLSLVLAAHINSRRKHCTVPVEGELVLSEYHEAFRSPMDPPRVLARRLCGCVMSGGTAGVMMSASLRAPSPLSCFGSGHS